MNDYDRDRSDRALEQLLSDVPPVLSMPEADKQRVLTALRVRLEPAATVRTPFTHAPRRRFTVLAAAAAVLVAALAVLRPGGETGGIAWADVARHLMTMRTMGGPFQTTATKPDGGTRVVKGRMSFKDPGHTRIDQLEEIVTDPDGTSKKTTPPNAVIVLNTMPEDDIIVQLFPERHQAIRSETDVTGALLGPWREFQLNPVFFAWSKLREVTADQTRVIGRREVAGQECVGFAAPLARVMGPQPLGIEPDGEIRVWASAETAMPLAVEVEKHLDDGSVVTDVIQPIEWNAPMPDSMFDDSVVEGYEVHERKAHARGFPEPELMPHVTLRIGPSSGGPVINELDVVGAVMGTVSFESWRRPQYRTLIAFELTDEAAIRLRSFLRENPETPLTVNFNGEFERPWVFRGITSHFIAVEVTPLRKRLIDFECEYLLRGKEAVEAELERRRTSQPTPP